MAKVKVKEEPRWDDRVAIIVMLSTWILLGIAGFMWESKGFWSWLSLVM